MAYNTLLNIKILEFLNRAQTRMGKSSTLLAHTVANDLRYENCQVDVETSFLLGMFVDSLDSNENDWTNKEIEQFIEKWTAKARLNEVPYFDHGVFNQRISFA